MSPSALQHGRTRQVKLHHRRIIVVRDRGRVRRQQAQGRVGRKTKPQDHGLVQLVEQVIDQRQVHQHGLGTRRNYHRRDINPIVRGVDSSSIHRERHGHIETRKRVQANTHRMSPSAFQHGRTRQIKRQKWRKIRILQG